MGPGLWDSRGSRGGTRPTPVRRSHLTCSMKNVGHLGRSRSGSRSAVSSSSPDPVPPGRPTISGHGPDRTVNRIRRVRRHVDSGKPSSVFPTRRNTITVTTGERLPDLLVYSPYLAGHQQLVGTGVGRITNTRVYLVSTSVMSPGYRILGVRF